MATVIQTYFDVILHFSDLFSVGRWTKDTLTSKDSNLQQLYDLLPTYCLNSKAKNTYKQYRYAFNSFCRWCKSFTPSVCCMPASETDVSLYLVHLAQTSQSSSKIQTHVHAISWAHSLAGYTDPCGSSLVQSVKEGALRDTGRPVVKKEPISPQNLASLVDLYGSNLSSLFDIRISCMCLLAFAGFLRFSELAQLKMSHVRIFTTHMILYIEGSKTDVYNKGNEVYISKTNTKTCPVSMLERYIKLSNIKASSCEYLFRGLSYCKKSNTYKLKKPNKPLSYTRTREIILSAFQSIGLDKTKFGLHSLRSGGATAAAVSGVNDRVFKKHGRWSTDKAKDGYVRENIEEKLSVSKNLGI